MKRPNRIVTEAQQSFTFSRRSFFLTSAQLAVGGLLAARMGWLSVAQNEKYTLLAEDNRINLTLIPPRRGWVVDRNGKPLALNKTTFRVDIIPDRLADKDRVLGELQSLLALPQEEVDQIKEDLGKAAGFQPVQVADNLDWDRFAAVSIRAQDLPGVAPAQSYARFYPEGAGVAHLLGYVGAASAKQYEESKDTLLITPGFKVGKDGIEKTVDLLVRGEPGAKRTEVSARGKLIRDLATRPDVSGKTIRLTIDANLQAFASRRLGVESGSVTVFDCQTGDILAMTSMPAYDPNSFSDGIGRLEWRMLQQDDYLPLLNKTLQGLYPPGSTLKPMVALALLQNGVEADEVVYCNGGYTLGNRTFRCLGRHGPMTMRTAIMKSCNTYFYAMGKRIGYDAIAPVAKQLGLGQEFDLPFPSQRYGTVPDSKWKQKKYGKEWSHADTLNATIGQGYMLASPFQLAVMSARIASGRMLMPHIFVGKRKPAPPLPFPPEHLAIVREGMDMVVNAAGTAVGSRLPLENIKMAGKTGTAQVRRIEGSQRGQSGARKYRDHGLFVCFAPTDNPRYAAAVVIDHGLGGARAAAPVAKDILTYLYDPAKAMASLEALEAGWGGNVQQRMAKKQAAWMAANDPRYAAEQAAKAAEAEAANAAEANNSSNAATNETNTTTALEKAKPREATLTAASPEPSLPLVTPSVEGELP
jgi:penicillin-binding protein 2